MFISLQTNLRAKLLLWRAQTERQKMYVCSLVLEERCLLRMFLLFWHIYCRVISPRLPFRVLLSPDSPCFQIYFFKLNSFHFSSTLVFLSSCYVPCAPDLWVTSTRSQVSHLWLILLLFCSVSLIMVTLKGSNTSSIPCYITRLCFNVKFCFHCVTVFLASSENSKSCWNYTVPYSRFISQILKRWDVN